MGSDITVYTCRVCGREMGFVEHFSHDHPDFLNDEPRRAEGLCRECSTGASAAPPKTPRDPERS